MKNLTSIYIFSLLSFILVTSCKRDDDMKSISSLNPTKSINLTAEYTNIIQEKVLNIDEDVFRKQYTTIAEQLEHNKRLSGDKTAGPILLEDLFIVHNGTINSIHGSPLTPTDEELVYEYQTNVPVVNLGDNTFGIEIADYNNFYTEILTELGIQTQNGGYLHLTAFDLVNLGPESALVNVSLFIGQTPPNPVFSIIPSSAYYYVGNYEHCSTGLSNGNSDVSSLTQDYLKTVAFNYEQCNNSIYVPIYIAKFNTRDQASYPLNISWSFVKNKLHHSNTYDCLGDDNDINLNNQLWQAYYNDARGLFDMGINHYGSAQQNVIWSSPNFNDWDVFNKGSMLKYYGVGGNPIDSSSFAHEGVVYYYNKLCI